MTCCFITLAFHWVPPLLLHLFTSLVMNPLPTASHDANTKEHKRTHTNKLCLLHPTMQTQKNQTQFHARHTHTHYAYCIPRCKHKRTQFHARHKHTNTLRLPHPTMQTKKNTISCTAHTQNTKHAYLRRKGLWRGAGWGNFRQHPQHHCCCCAQPYDQALEEWNGESAACLISSKFRFLHFKSGMFRTTYLYDTLYRIQRALNHIEQMGPCYMIAHFTVLGDFGFLRQIPPRNDLTASFQCPYVLY